jgi:Uma2 family endonuclease
MWRSIKDKPPALCRRRSGTGAEIAASSVSYDLHDKLLAYQRNGVKEYVVWRVADRSIDWFVLRRGVFRPMQHRGGLFRSKVFPGLWLGGIAMLQGERPS